jgi:release factor glutamine methyltransferase
MLAGAGVREPRRQAAAMWAWLSGSTVGQTWLARGEAPDAGLRERFHEAVERRIGGEPLPYVVGMAGFRNLEIEVDSRVLIPRPETEGLVDQVLQWAEDRSRWGLVADIGTGSGCLAIALAVEGKFERVVATDISEQAVIVARRNVERISPEVPIEFRGGPFCEPLADQQFDVIVSNPPYVSEAEFEALEDSVRLHEPRDALVSDEGGMEHITQLLEGASQHLFPFGLLALEVDSRRADEARELAIRNGWGHARIERDVFGRPRYLLATREQTK